MPKRILSPEQKEKNRIRALEWAKNNREKSRANAAAWAAANPEKKRAYDATRSNRGIDDPEELKEYRKTYYLQNKERITSVNKAYAEANRERLLAARRELRASNPEFYLPRQAKNSANWRKNNREKFLAYLKKWRSENPEAYALAARNRRALIKNAIGTHTLSDIKNLYEQQGGECVYCRELLSLGYHVDHIQPLSKGGANSPDNLQLTCPPCNMRKHASDPISFVQKILTKA